MAQYGCYTSVDFCAVRASLLDSDGTKTGVLTNGSAYNLRPISLNRTPTVSTGEQFEQRDGCGNVCFSREDPDLTTGEDLTLVLCQLDLELISLLTGGSVLLDSGGTVIGVEAPDPALTPPLIEFNGWTKAFSGNSQVASPRNYYHWVWPGTTWNIGAWNIVRGNLQVELTGKAAANANLGSGSFNDFPGAGVQQFFGVWLDNDIPSSSASPYNANGLSCGFVNTPASSS